MAREKRKKKKSGKKRSRELWVGLAAVATAMVVLLALCQAFEGVDWAALGLPEEFDYEEDNGWEYEPENILMDNTSIDPRYYYEAQQTPLVLAVAEGEPQLIGFDLRAAFVNPFSKHREAATEYIETAYSLLDHGVKVALMPGENEPVENKYFEENLKKLFG